jgi:hypothetical protein
MAIKFLSAIDHGAYQLPTVDGSSGQVLTTDGNGNVTFQSVAASSNYYLSGASFNTGTGVLTLTVSGATNQTVDLDGRYALSSHTHSYDNYQSWNLKTNGVQRTTVQSGGTLDLVAGSNVSLSYSAGGVVTIASTDTNTDTNYYVDGLSFDTGNGILTASVNGTTNRTVDLDGRYLPLSGGNMSGLITFQTASTSNGFYWNVNSDQAGINFKNTSDGDTNSFLNFFTKDNGNEYFKFSHRHYQSGGKDYMDVKDGIVRFNGDIRVNASQNGDWDSGTNYLSGGNLVWHDGDFSSTNISNWNTAYSWGNHASAGYITDGNTNWNNTYGFITASSTDTLTNKSGNISQWTNDSGYITGSSVQALHATNAIELNGTTLRINRGSGQYEDLNLASINTDTNTTYSAGSGLSLSGTTFSHADTSSQSSVNNSGRTYIQDITLDTYGHITAITSATETVTNSDTITRVGTSGNETTGTITLVAGGATTISQSGGSITISSTDTNTDTNNYLTGASFSTSNGVLTLTRQGLGDITVDLDGRFTDNGYADALNQHLRTSDSPSFAGMTINGNLTVTGTTVTDQVEVVSTSNGILFEGSAADAYEGLLLAGTLTADRTYTLPNATGTVALTSDIPTVNNATLTVQGTGALGGSGTFTANASSNVTISISHDDTSTLSGAYGGSNNGIVIEDITVDGYGHVTAIGTRDLDGRFDNYGGWRISDSATSELIGAGDTLTVTGAGATTVSYDAGTNTLEITSTDTNTNTTYSAGSGLSLSGTTFSHSDTSSASSVNNSGRTYIQDITIDTYGHVTAIASATETVTNTDTNYYVTGASFNTGNGIVTLTRNDGGTVTVDLDGRYQAAGSYAYYDHFRSLGVPAFTAGGGSNSTITTDQLIAEMEGDGAFDSYTSAFKTSWSYAGNDNLTNAGSFTETAGTSWLTWTDSSSDTTRGNITALAIAPNSGGSAYGVYIYNDQGSGYSPGWREIWTDKTLNPIVSATVSNDTTTYVKADGTSFSLTTSDANSNTYVTGASFNTSDGVLTLTRNSGSVTVDLDGRYQLSGTYNTIIGTDTDINTSGSTIIDNIYVTDGVITSMGTRTLTLADLGYTGATNADAYGSWRISDGTNSESLGSGATLTVTGTGATTASYDAASNTLTINSTDTNTNTTYSAGSGLSLSGTTFSHSDTSSQSSVNNSGRTYIQDITLDTYGHVTGITSATETVTNTDTVTRVGTSGLEASGTITFAGAGATSITQVGNTLTITSTDTNTNTTYSAGNGIGLSGTTFSVAAGAGLTQDSSGLSLTSGIVTAGTYGSTSNQTKVDTITVDTYGRVTGVTTGATGDITGVTAGTGLSGGGSSGTVTVNLSHLGLESLADPNADRVAFWDDSAGAFQWLTMGSNLSISGTTLNATDTNTNTTYSAGSGLSLSGTTFSHTDTSSQASVNNGGNTVIQDVTLDTYGHVTGLASKTLTLSGLGYTGASNADLYNYWTIDVQGQQSNITSTGILNIQGTGATNVTYDPVAKMVTIDSTDTNTNTTYSADGNYGLTLSGTTFRLENDRRRNATGEDVWSGNTHDYTFYDASIGIRWYTAAAEEMRLTNGGDLHVDGDVIAYSSTVSDRTFKDDINTISDALDKIKKLRGVEYVWNTGSRKGKKDLGLIAQEVEEVLPEIVHEHEMPLMEDAEAGKTYKTVDYEKMVGVLIEAMKDQQAMIETLTAKVETLEKNFNSRL